LKEFTFVLKIDGGFDMTEIKQIEDKVQKEVAAIQTIIQALSPLEKIAQERVIRYVFDHLGIEIGEQKKIAHNYIETASQPPAPIRDLHLTPSDIRTLKEQKNPKTAIQMAAIVGFYLSEIAPDTERKETINLDDIKKYFKQAQFELPRSMKDLLLGAASAGYFDPVSRGEYKLNPVGYNLVAHHLPSENIRSSKTTRSKSR
jgi:hypothetical protein